jgi:hypothetical protein
MDTGIDITEVREGDIVTVAGHQWLVVRWAHDGSGIYSCDLEPADLPRLAA